MQVLYEGWLSANEDWESSSLVISIRSSTAHRKRGARKWFTRDELARKYSTGETLDYTIADEIIGEKLKDDVTSRQSCRPHPDCPNNKSMAQYLCFDEATECDEQDEVMTSLMKCCDKDKKHSKKDKKRKSSTSSSDSGSGSECDSDSSDSSTESGKKKKKKSKKDKKNKSGKKKGKKSTGKKGKKLTKAQKEKEKEKNDKKLKQEEEKQQEKLKTEKRSAAKKARKRPFEILVFQVPPIAVSFLLSSIGSRSCTSYTGIMSIIRLVYLWPMLGMCHFSSRKKTLHSAEALNSLQNAIADCAKKEAKAHKMCLGLK